MKIPLFFISAVKNRGHTIYLSDTRTTLSHFHVRLRTDISAFAATGNSDFTHVLMNVLNLPTAVLTQIH